MYDNKINDFTKLRLILNRQIYDSNFINLFSSNLTQRMIGSKEKYIDYNNKNITISLPTEEYSKIHESIIKRDICAAFYKTIMIYKMNILTSIPQGNNKLSDILNDHVFLGDYIHLLLDIFIFRYDSELIIKIDL